ITCLLRFRKGTPMKVRLIFSGLSVLAVLSGMPATTRAQIFVSSFGDGTIGEYTTSGATVNPALISGLSLPEGIAASGGNLFVTSLDRTRATGTSSEYTTA